MFACNARLCFVTVAFLLSSASVRVVNLGDRQEVNARFNRSVLEQLPLQNTTAASCQFCTSLVSRPLHSLPRCNPVTYYPIHKTILLACCLDPCFPWNATFCETGTSCFKCISFPNLFRWVWLANWEVLEFFRLKSAVTYTGNTLPQASWCTWNGKMIKKKKDGKSLPQKEWLYLFPMWVVQQFQNLKYSK